MGLDDKRLAAAFFLPATDDGPSARELLAGAGATGVGEESRDASGLIDCRWAGMACKGVLDGRQSQRLLAIFFHQSSFLEMLPDDEAGAPAEPLLDAFAGACETLRPAAAMIVTHLHQADIDALWELGDLVLQADAGRLAAERLGLLYVGSGLDSYQEEPWFRDDREVVTLPSGRLLFAGRGRHRWH